MLANGNVESCVFFEVILEEFALYTRGKQPDTT